MSKVYFSTKDTERNVIVQDREGDSLRTLPWRLDLINHSPTGLNWGYGGSGAAQCSLAILADLFGDEFSLNHCQSFKWVIIAKLPRDWVLTEEQIREYFDIEGIKTP